MSAAELTGQIAISAAPLRCIGVIGDSWWPWLGGTRTTNRARHSTCIRRMCAPGGLNPFHFWSVTIRRLPEFSASELAKASFPRGSIGTAVYPRSLLSRSSIRSSNWQKYRVLLILRTEADGKHHEEAETDCFRSTLPAIDGEVVNVCGDGCRGCGHSVDLEIG
jgi:hypothetical protein